MSSDIASLSVLVSGVGSIGRRHVSNLRTLGVQQLAVSDPSAASLSAAEQEWSVDGIADYGEAIRSVKPDVVFVCSPTSLHVPQALEAVKAGAHVFIEKPLSCSMEGVDELCRIADVQSLTTMVGSNMRFHPGPRKIKELIDGGAVGTVLSSRIRTASYLPRWRREIPYRESYSASKKEGGAVLDCIHEIDLALWYFGPATVLSSATVPAQSIGLGVEGAAEMLLRHDSNVLSSLHVSFIQHNWVRSCEVVGTEGTIVWDLDRDFVRHRLDMYGNDGALQESFPVPGGWDRNRMYLEEIEHFLSAVSAGARSCAPVSAGKLALQIALQVRGSK